jgi:hypothetical protein
MNKKTGSLLSRRQFAHRAAIISAAATLTPTDALVSRSAGASPQGAAQTAPQLSPEGQLEADSRYEQILSLYGSRLNDAQKANIKRMCMELQPTLEKLRKFNLQNGNAPALYLKPLVERERKPQAATVSKKPS